MKWQFLSTTVPQNLDELKQVLLDNRAIGDHEVFFHPKHPGDISVGEVAIDPVQMQVAVDLLAERIKNQSPIVIFGDYDADGICATAILWQAITKLGGKAIPFIPDRQQRGYGLSIKAIDEVVANYQPALVITVDNGIVAHDAIAYLKHLTIPCIVTDHHQPEIDEVGHDRLPVCEAVVHTTRLCGAGVSWMMARALVTKLQPELVESLVLPALDLAGIATIADQVKLQDANRSFATWGISYLRQSQRPGIKALLREANSDQMTLKTGDINFVIAPRINAMGRLKHGLDALRLLCTEQQQTADRLSKVLADTNSQRQGLTSDLLEEANAQVSTWEAEHIIIVHSTTFHEGVIGLIAGKLSEQYHKPAVVISSGQGHAKASARSIPQVNIVELLRLVRHDLLEVGGHPMAAGFSLLPEKIELVATQLRQLAKEHIAFEALEPQLAIEALLSPSLVTLETARLLGSFEPFGQGNREPILALPNLKVVDVFTMGTGRKHLRLVALSNGSHVPLTMVGWSMGAWADRLSPGTSISVAGMVQTNTWKHKTTVQLCLKDIQLIL